MQKGRNQLERSERAFFKGKEEHRPNYGLKRVLSTIDAGFRTMMTSEIPTKIPENKSEGEKKSTHEVGGFQIASTPRRRMLSIQTAEKLAEQGEEKMKSRASGAVQGKARTAVAHREDPRNVPEFEAKCAGGLGERIG